MRRRTLFVLMAVVFFIWTFPHELLVERIARRSLATIGVKLELASLEVDWPRLLRMSASPPGYMAREVRLSSGPYSMVLSALHFGFGWRGGMTMEADACGGIWRARLKRGRRFDLSFTDVDPLHCLNLGPLVVGGRFGGSVELRNLGKGSGGPVLGNLASAGNLSIEGTRGVVSGRLPPPSSGAAEGRPIGEWEFARLSLEADIDDDSLALGRSAAEAQGAQWQILGGRISPGPGSEVRTNVDFRVRPFDDSARGRAVIALLPEATEGPSGWRRYRVRGTLAAPSLIGLR